MSAKKLISKGLILAIILPVFLLNSVVYATTDSKAKKKPADAEKNKNYASSPAKCGSIKGDKAGNTPWNCLFLEEPIGGKIGFDLYTVECITSRKPRCLTKLWSGGSIPKNARGPIQAVLTEEKDKPYQGPFSLLYGYVNLVYDFMSGIIVGVVVLFIVIGGIQMTTSGGDTSRFDAGKNRIVKSVVGLLLWFLASLILYTINPTFFAF